MALEASIRSPISWVTSLMYGVSPQPAQAPENSNSGRLNWLPLMVPTLIRLSSTSGRARKVFQFLRDSSLIPRCSSPWTERGSRSCCRRRLLAGRTDGHTEGTTAAVGGRDLHGELHVLELFTNSVRGLEGGVAPAAARASGWQPHPDASVGANERAATALDTGFGIPGGNLNRDVAFFPLGGGGGPTTVVQGTRKQEWTHLYLPSFWR